MGERYSAVKSYGRRKYRCISFDAQGHLNAFTSLLENNKYNSFESTRNDSSVCSHIFPEKELLFESLLSSGSRRRSPLVDKLKSEKENSCNSYDSCSSYDISSSGILYRSVDEAPSFISSPSSIEITRRKCSRHISSNSIAASLNVYMKRKMQIKENLKYNKTSLESAKLDCTKEKTNCKQKHASAQKNCLQRSIDWNEIEAYSLVIENVAKGKSDKTDISCRSKDSKNKYLNQHDEPSLFSTSAPAHQSPISTLLDHSENHLTTSLVLNKGKSFISKEMKGMDDLDNSSLYNCNVNNLKTNPSAAAVSNEEMVHLSECNKLSSEIDKKHQFRDTDSTSVEKGGGVNLSFSVCNSNDFYSASPKLTMSENACSDINYSHKVNGSEGIVSFNQKFDYKGVGSNSLSSQQKTSTPNLSKFSNITCRIYKRYQNSWNEQSVIHPLQNKLEALLQLSNYKSPKSFSLFSADTTESCLHASSGSKLYNSINVETSLNNLPHCSDVKEESYCDTSSVSKCNQQKSTDMHMHSVNKNFNSFMCDKRNNVTSNSFSASACMLSKSPLPRDNFVKNSTISSNSGDIFDNSHQSYSTIFEFGETSSEYSYTENVEDISRHKVNSRQEENFDLSKPNFNSKEISKRGYSSFINENRLSLSSVEAENIKTPLEHQTFPSGCLNAPSEANKENHIASTPSLHHSQLQSADHMEELQCSFSVILSPWIVKDKNKVVEVIPREKVLMLCGQKKPILFSSVFTSKILSSCKKVGEGVYGEVFTCHLKGSEVAIKIVPIEGSLPVNNEPQKTFKEILPEIAISLELNDLKTKSENMTSNFIHVNSIACVQGSYPSKLLKIWDHYAEIKESFNQRPDIFDKDQLFILFEFSYGGIDLESFPIASVTQAMSIIQQVACTLAVAEQSLEFEHRDLHWGNILVTDCKNPTIRFIIKGQELLLPSNGVTISIIDFSLSRLKKDGCAVYTDFSQDPELFQGEGDYQFDIYRMMKDLNGNDWKSYNPQTNILWLHYLTDKMCAYKYDKNKKCASSQNVLRQLRIWKRTLLSYASATDFVLNSDLLTDNFYS